MCKGFYGVNKRNKKRENSINNLITKCAKKVKNNLKLQMNLFRPKSIDIGINSGRISEKNEGDYWKFFKIIINWLVCISKSFSSGSPGQANVSTMYISLVMVS